VRLRLDYSQTTWYHLQPYLRRKNHVVLYEEKKISNMFVTRNNFLTTESPLLPYYGKYIIYIIQFLVEVKKI